MNVLPAHTTIRSFYVALVVVCFVTFLIVFNLRNAERIIYKTYRDWAQKMQQDMENEDRSDVNGRRWRLRGRRLYQAEQFERAEPPASNWWYIGYICRDIFLFLRALLPNESWREEENRRQRRRAARREREGVERRYTHETDQELT